VAPEPVRKDALALKIAGAPTGQNPRP